MTIAEREALSIQEWEQLENPFADPYVVTTIEFEGHTFIFPTRADVQNLKVGDLAPVCLGGDENGMAVVQEIRHRGTDICGKQFVGYEAKLDEAATITGSIKEDELQRTWGFTHKFTSHELDVIEAKLTGLRGAEYPKVNFWAREYGLHIYLAARYVRCREMLGPAY